MVEEPLSVAKLPSLKPSSGKEHTMSQHHAWGATLRPKALFNCSRLCTSTSYNGQAYMWFVRVCCSHEAIIDRGVHAPLHWIHMYILYILSGQITLQRTLLYIIIRIYLRVYQVSSHIQHTKFCRSLQPVMCFKRTCLPSPPQWCHRHPLWGR